MDPTLKFYQKLETEKLAQKEKILDGIAQSLTCGG